MGKRMILRLITFFILACFLCTCATSAYAIRQGTDGTELQVMEAGLLEIQLGADWAGVEFQLRTDSGLYPESIAVRDDGVLRLEIGGSSSYVLSCMGSTVSIPTPDQATTYSEELTEISDNHEVEKENTRPSIPALHLAAFTVGLVLAVGCLISMYLIKKHRSATDYSDEDEEDESSQN